MPAGIDLANNEALESWKLADSTYLFRKRIEVLQERRDYPVVNQMFTRPRTVTGGNDVYFDVLLDDSGRAQFVKPGQQDTISVPNMTLQGRAPWRYIQTDYAVVHQEVQANRGARKLIDLVKARRTPSVYSLCNLLESSTAQTPANSSDVKSPYGIPYYNVEITSAQVSAAASNERAGAHQGRNPLYEDGNTMGSCAGLDTTAGQRAETYVNWNDVWTNANGVITDADVKKIARMFKNIKFFSPKNAKDVSQGTYDNYIVLAGIDLWLNFNEKARENNDSLGAEIGRYEGETRVMGSPVIAWDSLDDATNAAGTTSYPFIAMNLEEFYPMVQEGDFFRFDGPMRQADQHTVYVTYINMTYNFGCRNRRKLGRIDYVA